MAEGVLVADLDGRLLVYGRAAERLLGLPPGSLLVDALLAEWCPHAGVRALLGSLRGAPAGGEARLIDIAPQGALHARARVVDGAPPTILALLRDGRAAARRRSTRRDFITDVSRQVRTPLAAIRGCSATLLGGALGDAPRARRFVEVIDQHAARLGLLADELGRLADLELGSLALRRQAVPVADALAAARAATRVAAQQGGVVVETAVARALPALDADRELLEEALARLLTAAVGGAAAGGRGVVAISADADDGAVRIAIDDAPPARLRRRVAAGVPRRGARRPPADDVAPFSLAVVLHIVRVHSGCVRIASAPGGGTMTTLRWPAAPAETALPAPGAARRGRR